MSKDKKTCLHDGGRRADDTWGGCLLAKHEKCAGSKCSDFISLERFLERLPETELHK